MLLPQIRRLAPALAAVAVLAAPTPGVARTPAAAASAPCVVTPSGSGDSRVQRLREYHDSGRYAADLRSVTAAARRSLRRQLARRPSVRRPAMVLDVDETSLSNWAKLSASDFGARPVPPCLADRPAPAIRSTLALYRDARRRGVAVFFVTGRAPSRRTSTLRNLRDMGYDRGIAGAFFRPRGVDTTPFKRGARARIERRGHTILVNVGDQRSDLAGGHARRAFKLPNPFYVIAGH